MSELHTDTTDTTTGTAGTAGTGGTGAPGRAAIEAELVEAVAATQGSPLLRRIGPFMPIALLLIWEVSGRVGLLDERFFPVPTSIVGTFLEMLTSGDLFDDASITLTRIAIGFTMGAVPGVLLGLLLGSVRPLRQLLEPVFSSLLPIPKIAIFPLLLLIFGLGETSKYLIVAIGVFFYLFFNTLTGVMQTPPLYNDVAVANGASPLQRRLTVSLPHALPSIFTGTKLAAGGAFVIIAAAEFVGSQSGLGYLIWSAWSTFAVSKMYVGIVTISVLGYVVTLLIGLLERKLVPWVKY
ncbi:ABC transporter permease [Pseudactinotalea sp. HY158]|uniref:ABC transporter permease n=1 Tax=Pseudactinotalea sp. HY158 TaxID=2654547 RepID=UPI00129D101F|nr:ABC transporter permease [Pseudactinotalea sp. HY158]QGH68212.1 ABC transporter permease subunit [Pseudactinotalea sp. HY158]